MSHLLHKFVTTTTCLTIILCAHLFIRVTDCSIIEYLNILQGAEPPAPPGCYTYMIMIIIMIEIHNIAHSFIIAGEPMRNNRNTRPTYVFLSEKKMLR